MRFVTHLSLVNSPEWRAIRHAALLRDGIRTRVVFGELDDLTPADALHGSTPIGSVEFCQAVAQQQGIPTLESIDYPASLHPFLGRRVERGTLRESRGCFVKPVETKVFEAGLLPRDISAWQNSLTAKGLPEETPCWISEPVSFTQEWRVYIARNRVLGAAQYDQGEHDVDLSSDDWARIHDMVEAFMPEAPAAYALDVGRTEFGLLLVEINDAWGTGYYPNGTLRPNDFATWCAIRWDELVWLESCRLGSGQG